MYLYMVTLARSFSFAHALAFALALALTLSHSISLAFAFFLCHSRVPSLWLAFALTLFLLSRSGSHSLSRALLEDLVL